MHVPSFSPYTGAMRPDLKKGHLGAAMDQISYDDFAKIDIRVGRIVEADVFPQARKPAYKLRIDFGMRSA